MVLSCLCLALAAAGQECAAEPDAHSDIVVTGERVPRTMRDTASSVDVTTADRIETLSGADRIEQVLEQVPNVVLGGGADGPAIRGQDTTGVLRDLPGFLGGNRPRATLQVDGRAISFNEFSSGTAGLWDIERIEVFRTPQTTTQGQNSIAGAIFIHSNDPTYEWEARARAVAGNYSTRQLSAVLSGPIVDDQLAVRVVGDLRRGRPSSKIVDLTRGANPNNDDYSTARFKLLGEPHFWPGARIEVTFSHVETLMPQIEGIRPPFRERRDPVDRYGTAATNVDSLTALVEHGVAPDLRASTTLAYGNTLFRRYAFPGLGEVEDEIRDFSAETVFDWNPEGPTRLVGGVSHRQTSLDQFIDLSLFIGLGQFDDAKRSLGLFGELTVEPLPRTTVTGGLRYQEDRQERAGSIGTSGFSVPLDYDESFRAFLPKLSIAYDFTQDLRAGVLVQRAYNPGGTTLRLDTGEHVSFGAETLWNYELFARARLAGGALTVAGNLFYMAMRNAQRFRSFGVRIPGGVTVTLAEIFNVPRARSQGAELTVDWRAAENFDVRGAIGLLDTKITRTDATSEPFRGMEFARSPELTASGSIDWRPTEHFRLSAQGRHIGGYFSDDLETATRQIGSATLFDARLSWDSSRTTLFGYVRNIFDTFRLRSHFGGLPPLASAYDPREIGLGLEARF